MIAFFRRHHVLIFFISWFVINLIQAATTELFDDEAYYWIYSNYPAWGYFDHPPMISWLIQVGYSFFQDELGVRLFIVVMNTATLIIIRELLDKKNDFLFYAIAGSVAVAQIGGIIAVPDIPLMLFVALFFLLYRKFIKETNFFNTVLLGISIALMLYSKYHGVLIVFFTLLSNPKLFLKYQTWLAGIIALLLFAPHLYWQYEHNFPSVQFHLYERSASVYRPSFTTEYIGGQVLLAGPLIGWLLIWAAIKLHPANLLQKALKYSLIGFYLFFLVSTLKGRVEANWTVPAFVGLIALSHQWLVDKPKWAKWVYYTLPLTLLIVLAGRIFMALDLPVSKKISKDEFHENRAAAEIVKEKANGLPVVYTDTYQKPSKYWFYTGEKAFGMNSPNYRRNNFNFWPLEDSLIGKTAYVIGPRSDYFSDSIPAARHQGNGAHVIENYFSFSKVMVKNIRKEHIGKGTIQITCAIDAPAHYLPYFQRKPYDTCSVWIVLYDKRDDVFGYINTGFTVNQIREASGTYTLSALHQLKSGKYNAKIAISTCIPRFPSLNSSGFKFEVE